MTLEEELRQLKESGQLPEKYYHYVLDFLHGFRKSVDISEYESVVRLYFQLLLDQLKHPYQFEPYHQKIRHPIDYYQFSLDFVRPLIDLENSQIFGQEHLDKITDQLARRENAIFLANHQTESDPQALALILEKKYPKLAESIIYVAGERVVTDPMAIPFSMGTDLLCIYSKRYAQTSEQLMHNKNTMDRMSLLLKEGGKAIYVAPSGGRDRKDAKGNLMPAPFDPNSVEMFYLMAKKAKTPTHFYPLALDTYDLLPPPETVQVELGERRLAKRTSIRIAFGEALNMETAEGATKEERRKAKTDKIWNTVCKLYQRCK